MAQDKMAIERLQYWQKYCGELETKVAELTKENERLRQKSIDISNRSISGADFGRLDGGGGG